MEDSAGSGRLDYDSRNLPCFGCPLDKRMCLKFQTFRAARCESDDDTPVAPCPSLPFCRPPHMEPLRMAPVVVPQSRNVISPHRSVLLSFGSKTQLQKKKKTNEAPSERLASNRELDPVDISLHVGGRQFPFCKSAVVDEEWNSPSENTAIVSASRVLDHRLPVLSWTLEFALNGAPH